MSNRNKWDSDTHDGVTVKVSKQFKTITVTVKGKPIKRKLQNFNTISDYLEDAYGESDFATKNNW